MAVHALTEIEVLPGRERQALWAAARLIRRLAECQGFRGIRAYRSEAGEGLLILTEWSEWKAASAAESAAPIVQLLDQARVSCGRWVSRRLETLFHLQLPRRKASAGLAQTLRAEPAAQALTTTRLKEFGLRAMSLPGTLGVLGGRCAQDAGFFFCVLEFDSEAALIDFGGSPTRHLWARATEPRWWRHEPRLGAWTEPQAVPVAATQGRSERLGNLSVHIDSSVDGATVRLRLHGCLDDTAAERFTLVREALLACGCRDLTLDVSQLTAATPSGVQSLLATARQIKAAGGQFSMADNSGRYHQILRTWHLNQALSDDRKDAKRRKRAGVQLRAPGNA